MIVLLGASFNGQILFQAQKKEGSVNMIKGAQKQMIVLKTATSCYFEEAYFVLKSDIKPRKQDRTDLLTEANRILKESESVRSGRRRAGKSWLWFALGLMLGVAATAAFGFLH